MADNRRLLVSARRKLVTRTVGHLERPKRSPKTGNSETTSGRQSACLTEPPS